MAPYVLLLGPTDGAPAAGGANVAYALIERGEIIFAGPPSAVRGDAATMRIIGGAA